MTKVLTDDQVAGYASEGYVFPIRNMSTEDAADIRRRFDALEQEVKAMLDAFSIEITQPGLSEAGTCEPRRDSPT